MKKKVALKTIINCLWKVENRYNIHQLANEIHTLDKRKLEPFEIRNGVLSSAASERTGTCLEVHWVLGQLTCMVVIISSCPTYNLPFT